MDVPLEVLEREITQRASNLTADTCRFLLLIAEFDRREGWAGWGVKSCAHWLNYRCGIGLHTGREQVRVAHRLGELPLVTAAFASGELSYSKIRAITRIATPESEALLVDMARHANASQIDTLVRSYRRGTEAEQVAQANERYGNHTVRCYYDDDGTFVLEARLPPEDGALFVAGLEASLPEREKSVPAGTSFSPDQRYAEALVVMAETVLAAGPQPAPGGERHQVVVHVDSETLAGQGQSNGGRCEIENGPSLPAETARRLACDSSLVAMILRNGLDPLDVGRSTRSIPRHIRRALTKRDGGCRFPGCTERRFVDGHHILHWALGGPTALWNLVLLCRRHHRLVHEGGYRVDHQLEFFRPDGTALPRSIPLPSVAPNRIRPDEVAAEACVSLWDGEQLDHDIAVGLLQTATAG